MHGRRRLAPDALTLEERDVGACVQNQERQEQLLLGVGQPSQNGSHGEAKKGGCIRSSR